jgi:hypothetical protein
MPRTIKKKLVSLFKNNRVHILNKGLAAFLYIIRESISTPFD